MRIGFSLPQVGVHAQHFDELPAFAKQIEDLGAAGLWVSDRVLAAVDPTVGYGGSDTIPEAMRTVLDPLALITAIGMVTQRLQIGTNVLIAPWYPPMLLARYLTTADIVTKGRLVNGFGTGWSPEEYQSVGVPMNQRGSRLEECLDILDLYWSQDQIEYKGKHWSVPLTHVGLKPVQKPRPPLYLAAFAPASFARVGRRADGWMPAVVPGPGFDPGYLAAGLATIRAEAEKAGRDPQAIDALVRVNPRPGISVPQVITAIEQIRDQTGIDNVYVDVNIYRDHAEALDVAGEVFSALGG